LDNFQNSFIVGLSTEYSTKINILPSAHRTLTLYSTMQNLNVKILSVDISHKLYEFLDRMVSQDGHCDNDKDVDRRIGLATDI